jgi:O-antigen ligase
MKELLPGSDSLSNRISFYHILLLMVSLPFDRFYSHIILVSFAVHTLIQLKKDGIKPILSSRTLAVQAVFFISAIATIYTAYRQEAFNEWGRNIVILILPLLFCLNTIDLQKYRPILLLVFAFTSTATIFYLYASAFVTIRHYGLPFRSIFTYAFTNHNFSEPIDMHATYLSMQLVIALVSLLYLLMTDKITPAFKIICGLCSLILLAGMLQLGSKSILAILFIMINLVLPYYLLSGRKRVWVMLSTISISVVLVVFIFRSHNFKERYITELQTDLSTFHPGHNPDPRLARWQVAVQLIKAKPLLGYGSGSEPVLLRESYYDHKLYSSYINKLNAHNQYLSFLLKTGVWGLAIYLLVLQYGFRIATQKKDVVFISFMVMIVIVSLSENVLDVDKGVFFYGFFFSFFLFSYPQRKVVTNNRLNDIYLCVSGQPIAS